MTRLLRCFTLIALGLGGAVASPAGASAPKATVDHSVVPVQYGGKRWGQGSWSADGRAEAEAIAQRLEQAWDLCRRLKPAFQVDCLAEEYKVTAASIPRSSQFAATRTVLTNAAAQLESVVAQRRDTAQPAARVRVPASRTAPERISAPITPVRPEATRAVELAAAQIVQNAAVTLLRSVPDTDPRQANFQRISLAFEETAVLLRS